MKEFKTHQSSMLRDGRHPRFVALPGVGGVWGKFRAAAHLSLIRALRAYTFLHKRNRFLRSATEAEEDPKRDLQIKFRKRQLNIFERQGSNRYSRKLSVG